MTLRWTMFTAVLLAAIGGISWYTVSGDQPLPGYTYRWWDNTLEKVEIRRADGTLQRRTLYGEDGTSVLRHEEYNYAGKLTSLEVRLPDGNMESTTYGGVDYTVITEHSVSLPNTRPLLMESWSDTGQKRAYHRFSPDGRVELETRLWFEDGSIEKEQTISDTGEINVLWYWQKDVLRMTQKSKVGGDAEAKVYYRDGKTVQREETIRGDVITIKSYSPDGVLRLVEEQQQSKDKLTMTAYNDKGKIVCVQRFKPVGTRWYEIVEVDEYNADEKLVRKWEVDSKRRPVKVTTFRDDGTISSVRHLRSDHSVSREQLFDEKGASGETKDYPNNDLKQEVDSELFKVLSHRGDE